MQLDQAIRRFTLQLQADGRSAHTIAQYRRHLALLLAWLDEEGRDLGASALTHEVVAEFLASEAARERHGGGRKQATTVNALRSSLRCFCRFIHAAGYVDRDAGALIRRARASSTPARALTAGEQERLIATLEQQAPGSRDHLLFLLMLRTGLRISEALGLRAEDVDFEAGELVVRTAKNDRPARVPLPKGVRGALRRYAEAVGPGPLFRGRARDPMSSRHANRRLRSWLTAAEIRAQASCHSLRHTFATDLYRRTGDVLVVGAALRHRSVTSTAVYAREAVARMPNRVLS